ncbi:ATP-binding protein [Microbacterium aoyamense]|uniref:histidine kinase n=1 Tax=Microbacterium aoyamense TaxID=344166 RepID=A0ABP5BCB4_9MICO|nr:HAMP domain-containing sensor histidine kinase [Microbacterium aoyamense]
MARTPRPISARARILAAVLAVACVGLAIVGSVTFLVQREWVLREIDDRLIAQVEVLDEIAEEAGDPPASVEDFLRDAAVGLVPGANEASLAIIDGVPLFSPSTRSGFDISQEQSFIDRVVAETDADTEPIPRTVVTDSGSVRYIAIPVTIDGETGVYVRAVDLEAELAPVSAAMTTYGIAAIVVLVAMGVVGWFVTGRLLSPIRHLRETADSITLTDLSPRLSAEGNDDIADLSRTVNSMLDRLEGSVDVQRQLLDDVRHELKTPITIVRGHLELMDPSDVTDVQSARALGIAELDRMTRLVEDIDVLATVEGGSFATERLELRGLTHRVGELVSVIPGHRWSVETAARAQLVGDYDRLIQAWLQLAENAAKYTPEGTPIEIGSGFDGEGAHLWVRDHGSGIPPAVRHRIFRRFDRAHGKRTVGGSGLGLAIVDAIAKAHGGHCGVTDTPGGGATFTIHLPAATTAFPAPVRAGDVVLQRDAAG